MTVHVASRLLVQAATRRQIKAALDAITIDTFADVVTDHLIRKYGRGGAERIIAQMAVEVGK